MSRQLLDRLDPTDRVLKRAQYEAFAFSLFDGDVLVRNESHSDPATHEYRVTIVDGVPIACECPADTQYDGPCKHRTGVAIRPKIIDVANQMQLVADGGYTDTDSQSTDTQSDDDPEQCDCEDLRDGFPCWECVRTGRRELPEP